MQPRLELLTTTNVNPGADAWMLQSFEDYVRVNAGAGALSPSLEMAGPIIEDKIDRKILTQDWRVHLSDIYDTLPLTPVQEILAFGYIDQDGLEVSIPLSALNWHELPDGRWRLAGWPSGIPAFETDPSKFWPIRVDVRVGYADSMDKAPMPLVSAINIAATAIWEGRPPKTHEYQEEIASFRRHDSAF